MLIAFAVLAVMLVPILQIFGGGLGMTGTARTYAEAALLARSKLAEIGADTALEEGERSGDFNERGYHWRATIARDTSDVMLPDNTVVGASEPRQSRFRDGRNSGGTSGRQGFGRSAFGTGSSSRAQNKSFGSGNSGFGSSNSGFSSGHSSFGRNRNALGSSSRTGSAQSSAGSSSLTQGGSAAAEDDIEEDVVAQLITYQIVVTVEWSGSDGRGEVTLTSLRVAREAEPVAGATQ